MGEGAEAMLGAHHWQLAPSVAAGCMCLTNCALIASFPRELACRMLVNLGLDGLSLTCKIGSESRTGAQSLELELKQIGLLQGRREQHRM